MTCIKHYYQDVNEDTSFEAFKVVPQLIHLLGRDFNEDLKPIWVSIGIFIDILYSIESANLFAPEMQAETNILINYFRMNVVNYGLDGIKDGSFFKVFQDIGHHCRYIALFSTISGEKRALTLELYLSKSELLDENMDIVNQIIVRNKLDYSHGLFSKIGSDLFDESLKNNESIDILKLKSFLTYVTKMNMVSKTEILLMEAIINEIDK